MKIIGLEEHYLTPEFLAAWEALPDSQRDGFHPEELMKKAGAALLDVGPARLKAMDELGMDVQVLSITTPALQNLAPADAVKLQNTSNDFLASLVKKNPDRFQGFAALATPSPKDAAKELGRVVKELGLHGAMLCGRTGEKNLDHPDYESIFAKAAELRAPLYIHPQAPTAPVRKQYYEGFSPELDQAFSTFGLGWHFETGIQILRLILSGTFDRYPDLQLITGHWGEVVLFYLDRIDGMHMAQAAKTKKPISEYFRTNISITPSGILSQRYLRWAKEVVGVERILFALDYPFLPMKAAAAKAFLAKSELSESEKVAIASGNWKKLCDGIRR